MAGVQRTMVNAERLLQLLATQAFHRMPDRRYSGDLSYSRGTCLADLFERIEVGSAGKRGEVAYASVGISIMKGEAGLMEEKLLLEIASDRERGWFEFKNTKDIIAWEERLASVSPIEAAKLTAVHGADVLARTKEIRSLADRYEQCVRAHAFPGNPSVKRVRRFSESSP